MSRIRTLLTQPRRGTRIYVAALADLAVVLVVGFFSLTWRTGDDARYFGLARALLRGHGYTTDFLPVPRPETLTPPGQPAMLFLAMTLLGDGVWPGKLYSALAFVVAAMIVFAWARQIYQGDNVWAFCLVVMSMFTRAVLSMSCWYMVEMTFILWSFLLLYMFERWEQRADGGRWLLLGAMAGLVYLVRGTGLACLAAGGLHLLARRRWRPLLCFVVGFLLLSAPWMVRSYFLVGAFDAYVSFENTIAGGAGAQYPWLRIPHDIATAFPHYFGNSLPHVLFFRLMGEQGVLDLMGLGFLQGPVRVLILALLVLGFLDRIRSFRFPELYWVFYWLIICAPPFPPQGHWYIYPVLPLAAFYFIGGIRLVFRWLARWVAPVCTFHVARAIVAAAAAYTLAVSTASAAVHFYKEWPRWKYSSWAPERYLLFQNEYMDAWARFVEAGMWVAANMPADTLISSRQPRHLYLITEHRGWRYDKAQVRGSNLWERLVGMSAQAPTVLIEDAFQAYPGASFSYGGSHWALKDLFTSHGDDLELLYETEPPATRVWRLKERPSASADTTRASP